MFQHSFVTKTPMRCYDDDEEITSFYCFESSSNLEALLSDALYPTDLASLSLCILGESFHSDFDRFTVSSSRVDRQSATVPVQSIDITLPPTVTSPSSGSKRSDLFPSITDVLNIDCNASRENTSVPLHPRWQGQKRTLARYRAQF